MKDRFRPVFRVSDIKPFEIVIATFEGLQKLKESFLNKKYSP